MNLYIPVCILNNDKSTFNMSVLAVEQVSVNNLSQHTTDVVNILIGILGCLNYTVTLLKVFDNYCKLIDEK